MAQYSPSFHFQTDYYGTNGDDRFGESVSAVGDVDQDGLADFVIATGFGGSGQRGRVELELSGIARYNIFGEQAGDLIRAPSLAGDANGDGVSDFLVSTPSASFDAPGEGRGANYLIFGGLNNLAALDANGDHLIGLNQLKAAQGYRFDGATGGTYFAMTSAGDVNGDGVDDLVVSATNSAPGGRANAGDSFLIYGGAANLAHFDGLDGKAGDGRIDLSVIDRGARFIGAAPDDATAGATGAGDVNGDGLADVLFISAGLHASMNPADASSPAYLYLGSAGAGFSTIDFSGNTASFLRIEGIASGVRLTAARSVGDLNADGFDDIALAGSDESVYVVFGAAHLGASIDLSRLDGTNGFRLTGLSAISISGVGDFNGDGFADLGMSNPYTDNSDYGGTGYGGEFVVFGAAGGFSATQSASTLFDGDRGIILSDPSAADFDGFGSAQSGAGDVDGDGFSDIVVGEPASETGPPIFTSGYALLFHGARAEGAVDRVGTALDNRINGGRASDTVQGLGGSDTLLGWEGDDRLDGGDGNDVVSGGSGNDRIDGGLASDTLKGDAGLDWFTFGPGADRIDGGAQKDTLDCSAAGRVSVQVAQGYVSLVGGNERTTFVNVEQFIGSSGADYLVGGVRNDLFLGGAGDDRLTGAEGKDSLTGGAGRDILTGGAGADTFRFLSTADSAPTAYDSIADFASVDHDRIDLSKVDADSTQAGMQHFVLLAGIGPFTAAGQIRVRELGADTRIELNTDNDVSTIEASIRLVGHVSLTQDDFIV